MPAKYDKSFQDRGYASVLDRLNDDSSHCHNQQWSEVAHLALGSLMERCAGG